jgi:RNA polymerase sigma-70 factor (ECF subfamily)
LKGTWDSDRDPLVALQAGDPALFEAFVGSESSTFMAFFRRLGVGTNEAEDLVQEVFLKLFRHAATYKPSGRFEAFAFRIARNAWIDRSRRGGVRPRLVEPIHGEDGEELPALDVPSSTPSPGAVLETREEAGRVSMALRQLSEGQRLVFELGVVQELGYSEIARMLEIPEGTVKSRMFNAVRKLRALLEETSSDESSAELGGRRASS